MIGIRCTWFPRRGGLLWRHSDVPELRHFRKKQTHKLNTPPVPIQLINGGYFILSLGFWFWIAVMTDVSWLLTSVVSPSSRVFLWHRADHKPMDNIQGSTVPHTWTRPTPHCRAQRSRDLSSASPVSSCHGYLRSAGNLWTGADVFRAQVFAPQPCVEGRSGTSDASRLDNGDETKPMLVGGS